MSVLAEFTIYEMVHLQGEEHERLRRMLQSAVSGTRRGVGAACPLVVVLGLENESGQPPINTLAMNAGRVKTT